MSSSRWCSRAMRYCLTAHRREASSAGAGCGSGSRYERMPKYGLWYRPWTMGTNGGNVEAGGTPEVGAALCRKGGVGTRTVAPSVAGGSSAGATGGLGDEGGDAGGEIGSGYGTSCGGGGVAKGGGPNGTSGG
eukprot:1187483-Pleurochrysis_carterae.AAC.1